MSLGSTTPSSSGSGGVVTGSGGSALAQDGADITSPTAMPAGGSGIRGWLSAIWTKLNGSLAVTGTFYQATQPVSIASMPSTAVTGPLTDTQLRATALPVSGAFYQATQPVSIASMPSTPVTGTFWQATQPVSIASMPSTPVTGTFFQATQPVSIAGTIATNTGLSQPLTDTQLRATAVPVSGTFFLATQPISAAALPLPAGAATETTLAALNTKVTAVNTGAVVLAAGAAAIGTVAQGTAAAVAGAWTVKHTDGTSTQAVKAASTAALAADPAAVVALHPLSPAYFKASDVVGTALSGANTTATLTVAAGGAGNFLYITRIRVTMHNTAAAAVAGSAVTLAFTTTNIPGALAWTEGNALAAGSSKVVVDEYLDSPIKTSAANTATTIVMPACGAGVLARATLYGYYGP